MQLLRSVWSFGATIIEMVHLWKLFCLSVLEQSCVVWGSSITQENEEDLERTQKSFARLVLGDKYSNYESALIRLDLEDLVSRRRTLMIKFAKTGIENRKLHELFPLRKTSHDMDLRYQDKYQTALARTQQFRKSSIPFMQRQLNLEDRSTRNSSEEASHI